MRKTMQTNHKKNVTNLKTKLIVYSYLKHKNQFKTHTSAYAINL